MQWEWATLEGQTLRESSALVDFGFISMGARRDASVKLRNVGRSAFTMKEFAQLMGSPVSINNVAVDGQAFLLTFDPDLTLAPTEETIISIAFIPPIVVEPFVDHTADLELRTEGANVSTLSLKGRAIAGACALPEVIDFGALPLGKTNDFALELRNDGEIPARFSAGAVTDAAGAYYLLGLGEGSTSVPAGGTSTVTVRFSPQEPREYNGTVTMRRADSCPEQVVQLKGRGVTSCLSWEPNPSDAATGLILSYGAVPPGAVKEGTVTFKNECTVPVAVSRLRSNETTFVITAPTDGLLNIPAATRDSATGTWTSGSDRAVIDFQPRALGLKQGLLLADTDLDTQQALQVAMRGNGGGPKLDARPAPLNFGRVGYTPGSATPLVANRSLRITNVGTRPVPVDPEANLHLGVGGYGTMYFSVRAISGTLEELCIGDYANGACDGSLTANYDQAVGIEAGTAGLALPVRLIPASPGPKEYELTIYSNDLSAPETRVQILATAIEAPNCNFTVSPTTIAFGLIDSPQVKENGFTLTNLGTAPSEVCFFSSFELDPTSHAMFSLPGAAPDLELAAGATATINVRAAPQAPATVAASVTGKVTFSVPSESTGNTGSVDLTATLTPACLTIAPNPLDFGNTQLVCGSAPKTVVISNTCSQPVTFSGAVITDAAVAPNGTGNCAANGGCPQFELVSQGATGVLMSGQSRVVSVRFKPVATTAVTGKLQINVTQGASTAPYEVTLRGTGIPQTGTTCVTAACPGPMTVQANTQVSLTTSVMTTGSPTCAWSVASRPATSGGTFSAPTNCNMTNYFADVVGTHVVSFNVADGTGATAQCQTPITVLPSGDLWIEMTWDKNYDLDLALLNSMGPPNTSPGAWSNDDWSCNYIRWGNRPLPDGPHDTQQYIGSWWKNNITPVAQQPTLDRDDRLARGPENIRINSPSTAVYYTIGSHMFGSSVPSGGITSTIKLYCGGSLITTQTRTMSTSKQLWIVGTVQFPGVGGQPCTFTPVNSTLNAISF